MIEKYAYLSKYYKLQSIVIVTLVLLLLASVYSFLHDSSESEYASESSDSGLAKNRLALMWSSVTGESGGVTSTQLSSFIRCCIEAMSMICVREENRYVIKTR